MAALTSISSGSDAQAALAFAQRKVQQDQEQVQQDSNRLDQSQNRLGQDRDQLRQTERDNRVALQGAPEAVSPVRLDRALALAAPQPQLNTRGETIGSLINVTA